MRKRLLQIGLLIFVIGVVLSAVGFFEGDALIHSNSQFSQLQASNVYGSLPIQVNASNVITLMGTPGTYYLVNSSVFENYANVPSANQTALQKYQISATETENIAGTFEEIFDSLPSGTYYVVSFGKPTLSYSIETSLLQAAIFGFLLIIGIVMVVAGFIIILVAIVRKPKQPELNPDELLAQYEKKQS